MLRRLPLASFLRRTRAIALPLRYLCAAGLVLMAFALRHAAGTPAAGAPFALLLLAVMLAAALFDSGSGHVATGLATLLGAWLYRPPTGTAVADPANWMLLGSFVAVALVMTTVIEALHRALHEAEMAGAELRRARRVRGLILREFHHRTRNDLGSLVGLLMLRARIAPSPAAREALREAADHALALARVHARLTLDDGLDRGEAPQVCTRDFVLGLCADIEAAQFGRGLRPVRLAAEAEAHWLSAERAVPLGLMLNETVTNALKYAFPEDRAGLITVRFTCEDASFALRVEDDGIGLPPESELDGAPPGTSPRDEGIGTRLLRALAAQLRGRFDRRAGSEGRGTVAELRFPVAEPGGALRSGTRPHFAGA